MLDDLKYIHQKDSKDSLGFAAKQADQLRQSYDIDIPFNNKDIANVVYGGIGGSSLPALMSLTWPRYTIPFEIWRRYGMPSYTSAKTLLLANSYSGSTEETLSAVAAAEEKGARILAVATGGKLIDTARTQGHPYIELLPSPQPRLGTLSVFASLLTICKKLKINDASIDDALVHAAADFLLEQAAHWAADVPTDRNPAKQLALELAGTTPIIYSDQVLLPAAYKWKISFNEAAKNTSWYNELPEFSHNEFTGWSSHPVDKPFSVIDLRSTYEHPRVTRRFELSDRLLSGKRPHAHAVHAEGSNVLEHMLYAMVFGDFVSIYVALLNGQDPSSLTLVDTFKSQL